MPKSKVKAEVKEEAKPSNGWYKGYDMRWLRKEVDHEDFHLVKEYDDLMTKGVRK